MYEKLKAAAKRATPGPWRKYDDKFDYAVEAPPTEGRWHKLLAKDLIEHDAEYIALANPTNILKLIAVVDLARELHAAIKSGSEASLMNSAFADKLDKALHELGK